MALDDATIKADSHFPVKQVGYLNMNDYFYMLQKQDMKVYMNDSNKEYVETKYHAYVKQ